MLNWIRSWFVRKPTSAALETIRQEVEQVLQLDLSTEASREKHGDFVLSLLRKLDAEIERIRRQANGYPANPISALVWMDGASYAGLSSALTSHFHEAGWLKREENASGLWAKATLAVCSHYHHMVGPAMLANADCHERLGDRDHAKLMYQAIVKDFSFLADDWSGESTPLNEEDRLAMESLQTALQRLIANGTNSLEGKDLPAIQQQTEQILSRG